ncbi:MAG: hypothetical protein AB2L24_04230 [Mangrovibacterium sp.]
MPHVTGEERNQIIMLSLESSVPLDSFVRVINAVVDATDLQSLALPMSPFVTNVSLL